jgi:hypothetical protein
MEESKAIDHGKAQRAKVEIGGHTEDLSNDPLFSSFACRPSKAAFSKILISSPLEYIIAFSTCF